MILPKCPTCNALLVNDQCQVCDPHFDGKTYEPQRDKKRLAGQLGKVFGLMVDGRWRTLAQIQSQVGGTEAAISARLRDLRKSRFGAFIVEREHVGNGLFRYRVLIPQARSA